MACALMLLQVLADRLGYEYRTHYFAGFDDGCAVVTASDRTDNQSIRRLVLIDPVPMVMGYSWRIGVEDVGEVDGPH